MQLQGCQCLFLRLASLVPKRAKQYIFGTKSFVSSKLFKHFFQCIVKVLYCRSILFVNMTGNRLKLKVDNSYRPTSTSTLHSAVPRDGQKSTKIVEGVREKKKVLKLHVHDFMPYDYRPYYMHRRTVRGQGGCCPPPVQGTFGF